jgi:hypothetical protein
MKFLKEAYHVLFTQRRLPHRIAIPLHHFLYKRTLDDLLDQIAEIRPIPSRTNADTTFHMLTSSRDVCMGVFSLQSFLRFYSDININIYGDPSLSHEDASRIKRNLPDAKVVLFKDFEAKLKSNKEIAYWFGRLQPRFSLGPDFSFRAVPWAMKVFLPHLYQDSKKQVLLDSDTLFVSNPDEVVSWCKRESPTPFHTRPLYPNLRVHKDLLAKIFPHTNVIPAFNAGFLGFDSTIFPIDYVLSTVQAAAGSDLDIFSDECLWRYMYSGVKVTELPYQNYPMLCRKSDAKNLGARSDIRYIHFHLKHRGGFYSKHGKPVLKTLLADAFSQS